MAEAEIQATDQIDNWVFDSLVNFLHGSIWKVPVVGFIEEKSVVFDPDSYNNTTEEKEAEFRKIHEEYKSVVDFMLSSFMEDLQVTPEQVEEACRLREQQSKSLPESHITKANILDLIKVALEQLWAAEDFTAFRRLMTRKNIDLQLQSLELLVAKYGVLSPSLKSGDSEETTGEDGEDDFLQVVIRYSDQLELFKCDYGTEERSPGCVGSHTSKNDTQKLSDPKEDGDSKNMKLHLAGVQFKNNVAPAPAKYQATLTSSSSSTAASIKNPDTTTQPSKQASINSDTEANDTSSEHHKIIVLEEINEQNGISKAESQSKPIASEPNIVSTTEQEPISENTEIDKENETTLTVKSDTNDSTESDRKVEVHAETIAYIETKDHADGEMKCHAETENHAETEDHAEIKDHAELIDVGESQLIQLEAAEAVMDEPNNDQDNPEEKVEVEKPRPVESTEENVSVQLDEKTGAEIASSAPEQRRLLTAVRKALETNPDETGDASFDFPTTGKDEDLQKRREYLRAQRDKLIAMKKLEREKLLANASDGQHSARPKSARAAHIALKNPISTRATSINEKSLSARRALADRLKQELIEK